jgi:6-pyruvoyltetrahydropterin/6-carboxytetrahydropterin synthase
LITLTRRYSFSASHRLIGMRERHKCSRLHGHNYVVEITVSGPLTNGLIVDAGDLDICMGPVIARLDHVDLNELAEHGGAEAILAQPTVENIAQYLWEALRFLRRDSTGSFALHRVRVYENERIWAEASL